MRDIDVLVMPNRDGQNIYDFKEVKTVQQMSYMGDSTTKYRQYS